MPCAILSIGTELTRGELVNTNATWLAERLTCEGFEVVRIDCCDDHEARIIDCLSALAANADLVVTTGGLGPTTDDLTTAAVAKALGQPLVQDVASLERLRDRLSRFGREVSRNNAKQVDFPRGSDILANPIGTAPGFGVRLGPSRAFFLPGVPREMKKMFEEQVLPRIRDLAEKRSFQLKLHTFGMPEAEVGQRLDGVEAAFPGVLIGYRAHFPEIEVKVLARAASAANAQELAERAREEVRARLGKVIFSEGDTSFVASVASVLRQQKLTLALAESCSGGRVAKMLSDEPASDYLLGGVVAYANSAKTSLLGVDAALIAAHGAVSAEVALAMARGARARFGADLALAVTGVAGPSGGSVEKPVGRVFLAVSDARGELVREHTFPGDRGWVQALAAYTGLGLIQERARATT